MEVGGAGAGNGYGGFNGGGGPSYAASNGGGGGGPSDVRTTSITTVPDSDLNATNDSRLIVAGDGDGAGSSYSVVGQANTSMSEDTTGGTRCRRLCR